MPAGYFRSLHLGRGWWSTIHPRTQMGAYLLRHGIRFGASIRRSSGHTGWMSSATVRTHPSGALHAIVEVTHENSVSTPPSTSTPTSARKQTTSETSSEVVRCALAPPEPRTTWGRVARPRARSRWVLSAVAIGSIRSMLSSTSTHSAPACTVPARSAPRIKGLQDRTGSGVGRPADHVASLPAHDGRRRPGLVPVVAAAPTPSP